MVGIIIHKVKCGKCDKPILRSNNNTVTYCERCNQKKKQNQRKSLRGGQKWAPCGHGKLSIAKREYNTYYYECMICKKKFSKGFLEKFWGGGKK